MTNPSNALATNSAPRAGGIPAELAGFAIQAKTMDEAFKLCEWLARSPLIPKAYQGNAAAIWTAGAMGQKLGIDVFTAMTGIASINGRPSIWGDLLRGLILSHHQLEALKEWSEGEGKTLVAYCTITRKGLEPHTARFGYADAELAGLLTKDGPWKQYTADMCLNRAFSRAARRRFADVITGLSIAEEQDDVRTVEATVTDSVPEPKPAKDRAAEALAPETTGTAAQQTIAGATPAVPAAPTAKDLNEAAVQLHGAHRGKATEALKEITKALGIEKISQCPAEKIADCLARVRAAHEKLNAEAAAPQAGAK